MANLDVGTGSAPGAGPGPAGITPPGGPLAGGPQPPGRVPFQPPPAMQRAPPSMPGAGQIGDALQQCAQASDILKKALLSFPHGSREAGEVNRCIGILQKIGPSNTPELAQTNQTSARDALRSAVQNALASRAQQIRGQNPQQVPSASAPGV